MSATPHRPEDDCKCAGDVCECVGEYGDFRRLRQEVKTRLFKDPEKLANLRKKAKQKAKQTLLESKCLTESDLAEIEEEQRKNTA
jgi:hypothetical protein